MPTDEEIQEAYTGVYWLAYNVIRFPYRYIELDDVVQSGMLGVARAINAYDGKKNVKFYTFACLCAERSMIEYVKREMSRVVARRVNRELTPRPAYHHTDTLPLPAETGEVWNIVYETLGRSRTALLQERFVEGKTYAEMSEPRDCTREAVRQMVNVSLSKVRKCMAGTHFEDMGN